MMDSDQPYPSTPPVPRKRSRVEPSQELKLEESRRNEQQLRDITRKILAATEATRGTISHRLHDEIAQALLGIHVRLLALKQEAATNDQSFVRELSTTQRLVADSFQTIDRFARELAVPDENQIT